MKRLVQSSILALVVGLSVIGCATHEQNVILTDEMAAIAELAAYNGTIIHVHDNPGDRPIFDAVEQALAAALAAEDYDPVQFADTLRVLPLDKLSGDKGDLLVGSAVIIWQRYSQRLMALDEEAAVRPVIEAVRNGMQRALNTLPQ